MHASCELMCNFLGLSRCYPLGKTTSYIYSVGRLKEMISIKETQATDFIHENTTENNNTNLCSGSECVLASKIKCGMCSCVFSGTVASKSRNSFSIHLYSKRQHKG